jgi:VIT1/CCC1 family predicted Fe2+/Mn2+ transporter
LVRDLSSELSTLVHEEIELATAELSAKGKRLRLGTGIFGAAGVLLLLALGSFTAAAVAGVALVTSVWLAALVVGAALTVIAGVMALVAKADLRRGSPPVPQEALASTKEDVQWLKAQTQSAKP